MIPSVLEIAKPDREEAKVSSLRTELRSYEEYNALEGEDKKEYRKMVTQKILEPSSSEQLIKDGFLCCDMRGLEKKDQTVILSYINEQSEHITNLNIYGSDAITDLSILVKCTKLQSLNLQGCREVENLSVLANCPNLQTLSVQGCPELKDLSVLANCPDLQTLYLQGCPELKDLSVLENCPNLQTLTLQSCLELKDLSVLKTCTGLQTLSLTDLFQLDVTMLDIQTYKTLKSLKIVSNKYIEIPKEWIDGLFQHPTLEDITLRSKAHTKWIMSHYVVKEAIRLKNDEETVSRLTPLQEKIQGYLKPKIVGDDNFYYCLYVYAGLYQHQGNESKFEEIVKLYEQEKRPEIKKLAAAEVLYLWSLTKLHELMTGYGSKDDVSEGYGLEPEPEDTIEAEDTQSERPEIIERRQADLSILRQSVNLLEGTSPETLSATTKQQILMVLQYLTKNLSEIESDPRKLQRDQHNYQRCIENLSTELAGSTSPSECQKEHETWLKAGIAEYIAEKHKGIEITAEDIHFELDKEGFSLDIGVELESETGESIRYCIELDGKHHEDNYFQVLSDEFRDEYLRENDW